MTRRERVKAAIEHRPADRVPHFIRLCGDSIEKLKPHLDGQTVEEFLDNDVRDVWVPWWQWHNLTPDWFRPSLPTTPYRVIGAGNYADMTSGLKEARDKGDDRYFLALVYGSHFEKAYFARGIENFLSDMAGEPEFARTFLRTIIEKNLTMLENFLAVPELDGVLLGSDWGSQIDLLMSPAVWDEMIRPGEQAEYDLIHSYGKDVWIHSCGKIDKIVPRLVDMGVNVLNPVQPECMDITDLAAKHGQRLAFWGGITTQTVLPFGNPDEVRAEARRVRGILNRHHSFIFAPSQDIQSDVPVENLKALVDVAKNG